MSDGVARCACCDELFIERHMLSGLCWDCYQENVALPARDADDPDKVWGAVKEPGPSLR